MMVPLTRSLSLQLLTGKFSAPQIRFAPNNMKADYEAEYCSHNTYFGARVHNDFRGYVVFKKWKITRKGKTLVTSSQYYFFFLLNVENMLWWDKLVQLASSTFCLAVSKDTTIS